MATLKSDTDMLFCFTLLITRRDAEARHMPCQRQSDTPESMLLSASLLLLILLSIKRVIASSA